jgi:chemotaxis signal transduction protein
MELAENSDSIEILAFEVAGRRFALPAHQVRELVRAVAILPVPDAPSIEGVIDVRGEIVPVLDVRARYRLPAKGPDSADQLILATAANRMVAIRVDRALGLTRLEPDAQGRSRNVLPGASDRSCVCRSDVGRTDRRPPMAMVDASMHDPGRNDREARGARPEEDRRRTSPRPFAG